MPYPSIDSELAMISHMFICKKSGNAKELLKIQTIKNKHKLDGFPITNYYKLNANDIKNPCKKDSFVDLEKDFILNNVVIPINLTTTPSLHDIHFNKILGKIGIYENIEIDLASFLSVNYKCTRLQPT